VASTRPERREARESDPATLPVDEVLALLGDDYVVDIVQELADSPLPARTLADRCGMSRATAYRRLDRLADAGLVASRTRIEGDGHHRQEFRLVLDELELQVGDDGVDCTVRVADRARR
jgi:DNA-binding transcriptional ArsR family regulator